MLLSLWLGGLYLDHETEWVTAAIDWLGFDTQCPSPKPHTIMDLAAVYA